MYAPSSPLTTFACCQRVFSFECGISGDLSTSQMWQTDQKKSTATSPSLRYLYKTMNDTISSSSQHRSQAAERIARAHPSFTWIVLQAPFEIHFGTLRGTSTPTIPSSLSSQASSSSSQHVANGDSGFHDVATTLGHMYHFYLHGYLGRNQREHSMTALDNKNQRKTANSNKGGGSDDEQDFQETKLTPPHGTPAPVHIDIKYVEVSPARPSLH
jgi:hypothetical protein